MQSILAVSTDRLIQIGLLILVLIIALSLLRVFFHLAIRILAFGCFAVFILGMILIVLHLLGII
jgi:hypothetical protein